jgi:hypothetical protein
MPPRSKVLTVFEELALVSALTAPGITAAELIILTKKAEKFGLYPASPLDTSAVSSKGSSRPTRKLSRAGAKPAAMSVERFQALLERRVDCSPVDSHKCSYSPQRGFYTAWHSGHN